MKNTTMFGKNPNTSYIKYGGGRLMVWAPYVSEWFMHSSIDERVLSDS